MSFAVYMLAAVVWGLIFPRISHKVSNQILIRCSACGSKLYQRPSTKRWALADTMGWALIAWVVVWRNDLPLSVSIVLVLLLVIPWNIAVSRLVHAYWMWRHPLHCQGGGHLSPVPQV